MKYLEINNRRVAFTLVEVVAGLALLGTLMTAVTMARGRYLRQWSDAQDQLEAVAAADELLGAWWRTPDGLPPDAEGHVDSRADWRWRTTTRTDSALDDLDARVLRLEIVDEGGDVAPEGEPRVLAVVELVIAGTEDLGGVLDE